MRLFPESFKPNNNDEFKRQLYDRKIQYFRQQIYEYVLIDQTDKQAEREEREREEKEGKKTNKTKAIKERYSNRRDGFNLKQSIRSASQLDLGPPDESMIKIIMEELEKNKWKCKLGVANTMLFIYNQNDEPEGIESTLLM